MLPMSKWIGNRNNEIKRVIKYKLKGLNPATFLCLPQARTWISKVMSWSFFSVH